MEKLRQRAKAAGRKAALAKNVFGASLGPQASIIHHLFELERSGAYLDIKAEAADLPPSAVQKEQDAQQEGLLSLYRTANGPSWPLKFGWAAGGPSGSWHGLRSFGGRVVELHLGANGLRGGAGSFTDGLPFLRILDLSRNKLSGLVPTLRNCPELRIVDIHDNNFTGPFFSQAEIGKKLERIVAFNNGIAGTLPRFPPTMRVIACHSMSLEVVEPECTAACTKLEVVTLDDNKLEGGMLDIKKSETLRLISMSNNRGVVGNLPRLGRMLSLHTIQLGRMDLSGELPDFGYLSALHTLNMSDNALTGVIGEGYLLLRDLKLVNLAGNSIGGTLAYLAASTGLTALHLGGNNIGGPVPEYIGRLKNLRFLDISHNNLTSALPASFATAGGLGRAEEIKLNGNAGLTGPLPSLVGLKRVRHIDLSECGFFGNLPAQDIARMPRLRSLSLRSCNLTGGFPQLYSTLTWLTVLRIDGNQLVGSREAGITLRKTLGNTSMCCEPQRSRPAPLERPPPGPPEIIPPPETAEMMLVARAMNYKRRTTSEEMDRLGVSKILS